LAIHQDAQDREEFWLPLDLIEYHQPLQGEQGIRQPCQIPRVFQIKHGNRDHSLLRQLSRQRRFPDLPSADHGDNRRLREQGMKPGEMA
jgi:hypothetical protein